MSGTRPSTMASPYPESNLLRAPSTSGATDGPTYFTVVVGKHQAERLIERIAAFERRAPLANMIVIADSVTLGALVRRNYRKAVTSGLHSLKGIDNLKIIHDVRIFSMLTAGEEAYEEGADLYKKIKSEYDNFKLQEMYEVASSLMVFAGFAALRKASRHLIYFNLRIETGHLGQKAISKMKPGRSFRVALTLDPDQYADQEPTTGTCPPLVRPSDLLARNSSLPMARCRFTPDLMYMAAGETCASGMRDVLQVSKLQMDQIARFRSVYVAGFGHNECDPLTVDVAARTLGRRGEVLLSEETKAEMNITTSEALSHTEFREKYSEAVGLRPLEYMLEAIFRQHNVCKLRSERTVRMGAMRLSGNESSVTSFIQQTVLDPAAVGVHSAGGE